MNAFFLPKDAKTGGQTSPFLSGRNGHPLDYVEIGLLIGWANEDAQIRFPSLARGTQVFVEGDDTDTTFSPTALALIDAAPDQNIVLDEMMKQLGTVVCVWSSLSAVYDKRRSALDPLKRHTDKTVAHRALDWDRRLAELAEQDRAFKRDEDERFE